MRKITVFSFVLAIAFGLAGCSGDDKNGISKADLEGKWNHETYKQTVDGQILIEEGPYSGNDGDCAKDYIQFNADNTAIFGDFDFSDCSPIPTTTTYSINGNKVTLMEGAEPVVYKVISITDTAMTVTQTESDLGITSVETYTFSKAN